MGGLGYGRGGVQSCGAGLLQKIYGLLERAIWSIMVCYGTALFRLRSGLEQVKRFQHRLGRILFFFYITSILYSDRRFVLNSFGMFDIGYNRCTFLLASRHTCDGAWLRLCELRASNA